MLHSASGFRGIRVGAIAGAPARHEPLDGRGVGQPRVSVTYQCAKGHQTVLVFAKLPEEQIPGVWDCRRCGGAATRDEARFALEDEPAEGYKSHLEYVKERRSSQDAEDVLAGALEKLRARRALPNELLGDA
ncbi:RNA polymerase-binding protein RbpA [Arthrobacter sp. Soil763]|uniref:RNA polymerase-binding protein RbpA n=1 Tax=Arthrobacter sp. Soil763 TaxID=1736402 RepID=UPI0007020C52|nr:RNA polymerase-binding protein RbpA [Arthrobacter sp. Soil763]KRE78597.1 electron transporter [Arthrobacter sp. Soil763]